MKKRQEVLLPTLLRHFLANIRIKYHIVDKISAEFYIDGCMTMLQS